MTRTLNRLALVAILALALAVMGCEKSRVTDENFGKVAVGMQLSQVESLMGKGKDETPPAGYSTSGGPLTATAAPENVYTWKNKETVYTVFVKDGKVVQKQKAPL